MGAVGGFSVMKLLSSPDSISIMSKLIHSPHWTWVDQVSLFIYSLVIYLFNLIYPHALQGVVWVQFLHIYPVKATKH